MLRRSAVPNVAVVIGGLRLRLAELEQAGQVQPPGSAPGWSASHTELERQAVVDYTYEDRKSVV